MLLFALIIVICLFAMPLAAALNVEIEKPLRNRGSQPKTTPKTPDLLVLPQAKLSMSKSVGKKAA
jgi:peptidoglycan/LPS O-acetylase OafA/YrhL